MKILFVWSAAEWSIFDVARGYRNALAAHGHQIRDFKLYNRIKYHGVALGEKSENIHLLSRIATEGISTDVLQLGGICIVDRDGRLCGVHRAKSPEDMPPALEVAEFAARAVPANDRHSA